LIKGKADKNRNDDSYSVNIFFRDEHQEKVVTYSFPLINSSIMVTNSNLSNFSANVIRDIQVLRHVSMVTQQTMDSLSDLWANMAHKEENIDSAQNTSKPIQLVVPRKKKSKKQQSEARKGFKVGASSDSPH